MTDVVQPAGWPRPSGYAHGVAATGRLLAVAGQIGTAADGRLVSGEFSDQFATALDNVVRVVHTAGGTAADIIAMTVFVVDRRQYRAARAALAPLWRQRMARHYPAMTVVEVSALLDDGALVEIQALAVLPS